MNDPIFQFIKGRHIDSFQKLRFVLFLHQNPELIGTCQEFAAQLYLGDVSLLEKIVADLGRVGLVDCMEDRFWLTKNPDVDSCLKSLTHAYEDPLARQGILNLVRYREQGVYREGTTF
jgi:hypothetical protein